MIIETLFNLLLNLFITVFDFVSIDSLDDDLISSVQDTYADIIDFAKGLINLVMPYNIAVVMGLIVIVIEGIFF